MNPETQAALTTRRAQRQKDRQGDRQTATGPGGWVKLDAAKGGVLRCEKCGDTYQPALPCPIRIYTAMMDAFGREHLHGEPEPPPGSERPPNAGDDLEVTSVSVSQDNHLQLGGRPKHDAVAMVAAMADAMAESLNLHGGENYVSWAVKHPAMGCLEMIVQRQDGKRPAEIVTEQRARIAELEAQLAAATAKPPDFDPITCPVIPGDYNGPHGLLPKPEQTKETPQ